VSSSQLRKHERFRSRFLRNQRDLIVYLPAGYDEQPFTCLPVLYLQDGQNLFDRATAFAGQDWNVRGAADHMIGIGAVQQLIIVGIYNMGKSRINEYTPTKAPKLGGGRADRYAKFLLEEVMPFIQREYRAAPDPRVTGIGGSSLGGLLSVYLGLKFPQVFGKIAALSPSVWWDQRSITQFASTWPATAAPGKPRQPRYARAQRAAPHLGKIVPPRPAGAPLSNSTGTPACAAGVPPSVVEPGAGLLRRLPSLRRRSGPAGTPPSFFGAGSYNTEQAERELPRPTIWLDIGTKEGPRIVPDVEQFRDVLLKKGWRDGEDLHYERVEGGEHNELAWSQRISRVLQFLYPAPPSL
jgi:predicted alpha/beta superfamily hydrolase